MNKILEQYKQMIENGSVNVVDDWIERGDFMLLTTNRNTLQELSGSGQLNSADSEELKILDNHFKQILTEGQR